MRWPNPPMPIPLGDPAEARGATAVTYVALPDLEPTEDSRAHDAPVAAEYRSPCGLNFLYPP